MTTNPSLLNRLEAADGPDRELFWQVGNHYESTAQCGFLKETKWYQFLDAEAWESAAHALVAEVLPDIVWTVSSNEDGYAATLYELVFENNNAQRKVLGQLSVSFASPAIALCIALLRATSQEAGDNG